MFMTQIRIPFFQCESRIRIPFFQCESRIRIPFFPVRIQDPDPFFPVRIQDPDLHIKILLQVSSSLETSPAEPQHKPQSALLSIYLLTLLQVFSSLENSPTEPQHKPESALTGVETKPSISPLTRTQMIEVSYSSSYSWEGDGGVTMSNEIAYKPQKLQIASKPRILASQIFLFLSILQPNKLKIFFTLQSTRKV